MSPRVHSKAQAEIPLTFPDASFRVVVSVQLQDYTGPEDPVLKDFCEGVLVLLKSIVTGTADHAMRKGGR